VDPAHDEADVALERGGLLPGVARATDTRSRTDSAASINGRQRCSCRACPFVLRRR
jgi:hypothetical protein